MGFWVHDRDFFPEIPRNRDLSKGNKNNFVFQSILTEPQNYVKWCTVPEISFRSWHVAEKWCYSKKTKTIYFIYFIPDFSSGWAFKSYQDFPIPRHRCANTMYSCVRGVYKCLCILIATVLCVNMLRCLVEARMLWTICHVCDCHICDCHICDSNCSTMTAESWRSDDFKCFIRIFYVVCDLSLW